MTSQVGLGSKIPLFTNKYISEDANGQPIGAPLRFDAYVYVERPNLTQVKFKFGFTLKSSPAGWTFGYDIRASFTSNIMFLASWPETEISIKEYTPNTWGQDINKETPVYTVTVPDYLWDNFKWNFSVNTHSLTTSKNQSFPTSVNVHLYGTKGITEPVFVTPYLDYAPINKNYALQWKGGKSGNPLAHFPITGYHVMNGATGRSEQVDHIEDPTVTHSLNIKIPLGFTEGEQIDFGVYPMTPSRESGITEGITTKLRVNYAPKWPSGSPFSGTVPSVLILGSTVTTVGATDQGGATNGYATDSLGYRLEIYSYTETKIALTDFQKNKTVTLGGSILNQFLGHSVRLRWIATDGWEEVYSTSINRTVGGSLDAPTISLSGTPYNNNTSLTVPPLKISGSNIPSTMIEEIEVYAGLSGGSSYKIWETTRTGTGLQTNLIVSNILNKIYISQADLILGENSTQRKLRIFTKHRLRGQSSLGEVDTSVVALNYTPPTFTNLSIGSGDPEFVLDKIGDPVLQKNSPLAITFSVGTYQDSAAVVIETAKSSTGSEGSFGPWVIAKTIDITKTGVHNEVFDYENLSISGAKFFNTLDLYGKIRFKLQLKWGGSYRNIVVTKEISWKNYSNGKVFYIPKIEGLVSSSWNINRKNFLSLATGESTNLNQLNCTLTWTGASSKRYVLRGYKIEVLGQVNPVIYDIDHENLIYKNLLNDDTHNPNNINLETLIEVSDPSNDYLSLEKVVLKDNYVLQTDLINDNNINSSNAKIKNNQKTIPIRLSLIIAEALCTEDGVANPNRIHNREIIVTYDYEASTSCLPKFESGDVYIVRSENE